MQDVGHAAIKYSLTAAITLSSCISDLSPTNDKNAEMNKQFHVAWT